MNEQKKRVRELVKLIRTAHTMEQKAKEAKAELVKLFESGELDDMRNGDTVEVFTESELRNTIKYAQAYDSMVTDMDAVKAHYAEIGQPVPSKIRHNAAFVRVN